MDTFVAFMTQAMTLLFQLVIAILTAFVTFFHGLIALITGVA